MYSSERVAGRWVDIPSYRIAAFPAGQALELEPSIPARLRFPELREKQRPSTDSLVDSGADRQFSQTVTKMIHRICLLFAIEPVPGGAGICLPAHRGVRYFISDSVQCDRFHMCDEKGRLAAEFLCQDDLVYEPISKQCGLPFKVDCIGSGRTKLQEPQPMENCKRLSGKWVVQDTCNQFIDCTSGVERLGTCQNHPGLRRRDWWLRAPGHS